MSTVVVVSAPSDPAASTTGPVPAGSAHIGPLQIGPITVDPPVVLAPMAGVTNLAFRQLCQRFGEGLFVSEMVNARGLLEDGEKTWQLASFGPEETRRSLQLYGTDPAVMGAAVRRLVDEDHVDHIDLNFGCPAPKVTRHGGGAAVPARPSLFGAVVAAAVDNAGPVPVTVKMRIGLDEDRVTFLEAGRRAADAGAAAVALHARTARQRYSGRARWSAIAELVEALPGTPVLGNGDIWTAADALAMIERTGCAGVVVGRACLGRPWFFGQLADLFAGRPIRPEPPLGEMATIATEHARLLTGAVGEHRAMKMMRKHMGWYLTGYPVGSAVRRSVTALDTLAQLDELFAPRDPALVVEPGAAAAPRGTQTGPHEVVVPDGWLDADSITPPDALADSMVSGG